MMIVCWYRVREFKVGWWLSSSNLERVRMRLFKLAICLAPGHWRRICIIHRVTHNVNPLRKTTYSGQDYAWRACIKIKLEHCMSCPRRHESEPNIAKNLGLTNQEERSWPNKI